MPERFCRTISVMPRRSQNAIASPKDIETGARAVEDPGRPGEVAVDDGGLAPEALLERERERLAQVVDAARVAQMAAGDAADSGARTPASGRPSSAASASARSAPAIAFCVLVREHPAPGRVGVGGDELRPGRLSLEHLDRLGDQLLAAWVAEPVRSRSRGGSGHGRSPRIASRAVELERPARSPALASCSRPRCWTACAQRSSSDGALGSVVGAELEGAGELPLGLFDVERERPLAGQRRG